MCFWHLCASKEHHYNSFRLHFDDSENFGSGFLAMWRENTSHTSTSDGKYTITLFSDRAKSTRNRIFRSFYTEADPMTFF